MQTQSGVKQIEDHKYTQVQKIYKWLGLDFTNWLVIMRSCNTSSFLAHNAKQLLNILLDEVFVLQSELKNLRIRDLGWGYLPLSLGFQPKTKMLTRTQGN